MGGELANTIERAQTPENGNDLEIEVKIVNLGDPDLLVKKLESIGADLETPKRRLRDRNFSLDENLMPRLYTHTNVDTSKISDLVNLEKAFKFLGYNILSKHNGVWEINRTLPQERRSVRIRFEDKKSTLTIKSPRDRNATYDKRTEINVKLESQDAAEEILKKIGYKQKNIAEKDRITYRLDGCTIDINFGPVGPPWSEIEGPNKETIFEVAKKLGYGMGDLASISDGKYYQKHGVGKEQLANMTFNAYKNEKK